MLTLTSTLLLAATVTTPQEVDPKPLEAGQSIGLTVDAERAARLLPASCAEGSPEWGDASAPEKKRILERCRATEASGGSAVGLAPRTLSAPSGRTSADEAGSSSWIVAGVMGGGIAGAVLGGVGGALASQDGRIIAPSMLLISGLGGGLGYLVGEAARHSSLGARVGIIAMLCLEATLAVLIGAALYEFETHPPQLFGSGQGWDF